MNIEKHLLGDRIFLLVFDTQFEVASTFVRFQEHYESPHFAGKHFTLEEFQKWYVLNSPEGKKTGRFTYYEDYNGFNVPSKIFVPFHRGKFDPLSSQEKILLSLLPKPSQRFYVMGVNREVEDLGEYVDHELAHALHYMYADYRRRASQIVLDFNLSAMRRQLIEWGDYAPRVFLDEFQAYAVSPGAMGEKVPAELHARMREFYTSYLVEKKIVVPKLV